MLFADWFNEMLGQGCLMTVGFIWLVGWGLSKLFSSDTAKEAARIGFWAWWWSDD